MPDLPPEQQAREQIDAQLSAYGWAAEDYMEFNLGVSCPRIPGPSVMDMILTPPREAGSHSSPGNSSPIHIHDQDNRPGLLRHVLLADAIVHILGDPNTRQIDEDQAFGQRGRVSSNLDPSEQRCEKSCRVFVQQSKQAVSHSTLLIDRG